MCVNLTRALSPPWPDREAPTVRGGGEEEGGDVDAEDAGMSR